MSIYTIYNTLIKILFEATIRSSNIPLRGTLYGTDIVHMRIHEDITRLNFLCTTKTQLFILKYFFSLVLMFAYHICRLKLVGYCLSVLKVILSK